MSSDLVEFLRARLDEDEQVARAATPGPWTQDEEVDGWRAGRQTVVRADRFRVVTVDQTRQHHPAGEENVAHIARHDPARVLADVAAKRALLDAMIGPALSSAVARTCDAGLATARYLALAYADHPEYRADEWSPDV